MSTGDLPDVATPREGPLGRPWVITAVVVCAFGTLGALANACAPLARPGTAPNVGNLFQTGSLHLAPDTAIAVAAATILALGCLRWSVARSWPPLVFGGAVLTLPAQFLGMDSAGFDLVDPDMVAALNAGAAQLVLFGVLGAGAWLVRIDGAALGRGAAAILVGSCIGGELLGAAMGAPIAIPLGANPSGHIGTYPSIVPPALLGGVEPLSTGLRGLLALGALGAAVLLLLLYRYYRARPELSAPEGTEADDRLGRPMVVIGSLSGVALIPVAFSLGSGAAGNGAADGTLAWLVLLVVGVVLAVLSGPKALVATVTGALLVLGVVTPFRTASGELLSNPVLLWFSIAVGVLLGAGLATTRLRAWVAGAACVLAALAAAVGAAGPLVTVLVTLAATATVGTVAVLLGSRPRAPVVLGAVVPAVALGAAGAIGLPSVPTGITIEIAIARQPPSDAVSIGYLIPLVAAGLLVVGWSFVESRRSTAG